MSAASSTARFDGKAAIVTGAGRAGQVGEAVAREFGQRGAVVAIIDRDGAGAEQLAAAMRADGLAVTAYGCDLTDASATEAVVRRVADGAGGRIHVLANVAGGFAVSGSVAESDPGVLQRQLAINLGSAYGATRACLPFLRAASGAAIAYITAAAALAGGKAAGMSAYVASKAAVTALMRAVAQEERANRVRANAVAPTAIRTGTNLQSMGDAFPYVEREAVANVIAFLCSGEAANITGQVIELT